MRYQASYTVTFDAPSDDQAHSIAVKHHQQLRDELLIDGVDHPYYITLDRLHEDGRDVLSGPERKPI